MKTNRHLESENFKVRNQDKLSAEMKEFSQNFKYLDLRQRWQEFVWKLISLSFVSWLLSTGLVTWFVLRDRPENALGYVTAWLVFTEVMVLGRKKLQ